MFPFGIDLADLSLKIVQLKKKQGNLGVAAFVFVPLPSEVLVQGEVKDSDKIASIIKNALKNAQYKKIKGRLAIASLPETKAFLRVITIEKNKNYKKEDIQETIKIETEQHIPFKLNEVYLDADLVFEDEKQIKFLVSAVSKKIVEGYLDVFKKAKIIPLALEIESIATSRALIFDPSLYIKEKNAINLEESILIVDLGSKTTSFIIVKKGIPRFTKSIPLASVNLTKAIQDALKISFQKAEKIKKRYGLNVAAYKGKVFASLKPHLDQVIKEINEILSFYEIKNNKDEERKIKKIFLCGGSANLKGLSDFLSVGLKRTVEKGNPLINLSFKEKELSPIAKNKILNFTTGIGLALRGVWDGELV